MNNLISPRFRVLQRKFPPEKFPAYLQYASQAIRPITSAAIAVKGNATWWPQQNQGRVDRFNPFHAGLQ
ncbi:MAG: hypothetical protein M3O74_26470 [Pseudomonadota bacterium]|nr:hypothetical protein [Pseudomonadota bacterium]